MSFSPPAPSVSMAFHRVIIICFFKLATQCKASTTANRPIRLKLMTDISPVEAGVNVNLNEI